MPTNPNDPTVISGAPVARAVTRLGRYRLLKRLGVGGMAEVYLAEQDGPQQFKKTVVVKRILPSLAADANFVAMFVREAQVAARLTHANVVQIYELGEQPSDAVGGGGVEYFIAMEYIDGLTLQRLATASWNAGKAVPIDVVVRTMADACRGLHAAHNLVGDDGKPLHLVHRDISPDNLMVARDGVTKVLDFGIAKGDLGGPKTRTGNLRGKIPYMSPEQVTGQQLDGRCDLWAVGVSMYWLLCGERPFDRGTDFHTMQAVLSDQPKPPTTLNPAIPQKLEKLILDLLNKDREARPADGSVVADELEEFASPGSGSGRRTTVRFLEQHMQSTTGLGNPLSEHGEKTASTRPLSPEQSGPVVTAPQSSPDDARPLPEPLPASAQRIPLADVESAAAVPRKITMSEADAATAPSTPSAAAPSAAPPPRPAETGVATFKQSAAAPPPPNHPVVDMLAPPKQSSALPALLVGVGVVVLLGAGGYGIFRVVNAMTDRGAADAGAVAAADDAGAPVVAPPIATVVDAGSAVVDAGSAVADAGSAVADAGSAVADAGSAVAEADVDAGGAEEDVDAGAHEAVVHKATLFAVKARAPRRVVWKLPGGKTVGHGSTSLKLPLGTRTVEAHDPWHKEPWPLPVVPGKTVDFLSIPAGNFAVTLSPDAKVYIGRALLKEDGLLAAPAGDYDVRIEKDGKKKTQVFHLKANDSLIIKP